MRTEAALWAGDGWPPDRVEHEKLVLRAALRWSESSTAETLGLCLKITADRARWLVEEAQARGMLATLHAGDHGARHWTA